MWVEGWSIQNGRKIGEKTGELGGANSPYPEQESAIEVFCFSRIVVIPNKFHPPCKILNVLQYSLKGSVLREKHTPFRR